MVAVGLCGCYKSRVDEMNDLKRPITIVSISKDKDILVSGADGKLLLIPNVYYLAGPLAEMKPGDVVIE